MEKIKTMDVPKPYKEALKVRKEPTCRICGKSNEGRPLIRFKGKGKGKPQEFIHGFCGTIAAMPPWNKPEYELLQSKGIRKKYRGICQPHVTEALAATRCGINPINGMKLFMMRDFENKLQELNYEIKRSNCTTSELGTESASTKSAIKHRLAPDQENEPPVSKKGRGIPTKALLHAPSGKIRCPCGGLYQAIGTNEANKSWSSHVKTKEHRSWMQSSNDSNIKTCTTVAPSNQAQLKDALYLTIPKPESVPPKPIEEPMQALEDLFKDLNLIWNQIEKLSKNNLISRKKKLELVNLLTKKLDSMYVAIPIKILSNHNVSLMREADMTWAHLSNLMQNPIIAEKEKNKQLTTLLRTLEFFYKNSSFTKTNDQNVDTLAEMLFLHLSNLSANNHINHDRKKVLVSLIAQHLETLFQSCYSSKSNQNLNGADTILNYLDKLRGDPLIPENKKKEMANILVGGLESVYMHINKDT